MRGGGGTAGKPEQEGEEKGSGSLGAVGAGRPRPEPSREPPFSGSGGGVEPGEEEEEEKIINKPQAVRARHRPRSSSGWLRGCPVPLPGAGSGEQQPRGMRGSGTATAAPAPAPNFLYPSSASDLPWDKPGAFSPVVPGLTAPESREEPPKGGRTSWSLSGDPSRSNG